MDDSEEEEAENSNQNTGSGICSTLFLELTSVYYHNFSVELIIPKNGRETLHTIHLLCCIGVILVYAVHLCSYLGPLFHANQKEPCSFL
jgi:hypothetical protein